MRLYLVECQEIPMYNRSWVRNPIRINFATVYDALLEKPFSFFLMVTISIIFYNYSSIEYVFAFELFFVVISLIISIVEKNKINKLLLSEDKNSLDEIEEKIRISFNSLALYSLVGWTYFVIGLINMNYYLIISSLMCIYFIGILTRRIDPYFN